MPAEPMEAGAEHTTPMTAKERAARCLFCQPLQTRPACMTCTRPCRSQGITAAGQALLPCCRMGKPALGGGLVLPKLNPQLLQSLSSTNSPAGRELRGEGASQAAAATQVATPEPAWLVSPSD